MKKLIAVLMIFTCLLSLAACGKKQPSLEAVSQAIEEGSLTLEDALSKGWVTQEWADEYTAQRTVPAASKIDANLLADFATSTLSGEDFTRGNLADVTLLAFIDPADENARSYYEALTGGYEGVKANGAEIVVCTKSETGNELFENAPFPVILYNDAFREAAGNNSQMIEGIANTASWYVNGSFYSAWYSVLEAEDLPDSAAAFVEMGENMGGEAGGFSGGMAVMG